MKLPVALTIAGSDSGGGAGIQDDLKTFAALGVHGTSAITAITAQNTVGVTEILELPPSLLRAQIAAVVEDMGVQATKTGMLSSIAIIDEVVAAIRDFDLRNVVVDPVMVAKGGARLLREDAVAALRRIEPHISLRAFERGLTEAEWPARLQRLRSGKLVDLAPARAELWLDGGHNEDGGRVLAAAMADFEEQSPRPLVVICGTLATKDTAGFLRHFKGLAQELLAVPIAGEHAGRSADEVAQIAASVGIEAAASPGVEAALRFLSARSWPAPPRVLIAGSLYLAGATLEANGTALE